MVETIPAEEQLLSPVDWKFKITNSNLYKAHSFQSKIRNSQLIFFEIANLTADYRRSIFLIFFGKIRGKNYYSMNLEV